MNTRKLKEIENISPELLQALLDKYSPTMQNPKIALQNQTLELKAIRADNKALAKENVILRAYVTKYRDQIKRIIHICGEDV